MTDLERAIYKRGFVRCPNRAGRWYAGGPGVLEASDGDIIINGESGHIERLVTPVEIIPGVGWKREIVFRFDTIDELAAYLEKNGKISEGGMLYINNWE